MMATIERFDHSIRKDKHGYFIHYEQADKGRWCESGDVLGIVLHLKGDNASICRLLDRVGIENYGSTEQIHRVRMLADRDAAHVKMIQQLEDKVKELQAKKENK